MNKIYKVIWSKTRNCYVAVSELARNHGKGNVRSEKRGMVKGASVLALSIALSLGVTGSVWAEDLTVNGNVIAKNDAYNASTADGGTFIGRYLNIGKTTNTIKTTNGETAAAIGRDNKVYGDNAIAVGIYNSIGTEDPGSNHWNGFGSIVVGGYSRALGQYSAAFGQMVSAIGDGSFAQGGGNIGGGGKNTTATGRFASAFNRGTEAKGEGSASHGFETIASADWSFASGYKSNALGTNSAVFGNLSQAAGNSSFAAGYNTKAGFSFLDEDGNPKNVDENGNTVGANSYAAAFGRNTTASGAASFATGYYTNATGNYSTAFNAETRATGYYASAFNYHTEAAGYGAAAFGNYTHATGVNSFAIGSNTHAESQNAFATGYENHAIGKDSVAFGNYTYANGNRSVTFGSGTQAGVVIDHDYQGYPITQGEDSFAYGLNTKAFGDRSTASGTGTFASGEVSIASGNMTRALGQASSAGGSYTVAYGQNATSFGEYAHAIGKNTTAFGHYTTAGKRLQTEEEKALGIYTMVDPYTGEQTKVTKVNKLQYASMLTDENGNVVTDNDPNHVVDDVDRNYVIYHAKRSKNTSLFAIRVPIKDEDGNPTGEYKIREVYQKPGDDTWYIYTEAEQAEREQAAGGKPTLLVNYDGVFVTDTSVKTDNAVAFGNDTEASAENALAFGDATLASNKRATAFGNHTVVTGDSATSFGDTTLAAGRNATAFGESTVGTMQNATAFGQESAALAKNATAFGVRSKALGQASTTWGDESIAPGKYSTAFGEDSEAFAQDSAAWGSKTVAGVDKNDQAYKDYKDKLTELREKENQLKLLKKNGVTADILDADGNVESKGSISLEAEIREDEATLNTLYAKLKNLGKAATAFGESTNAVGTGSTAWGSKSVATGKYSTAFGESSKAYGQNSIAGLGGTTGTSDINATGAIAIGKGAVAQAANNIALGQKANALGTDSIVIGAVIDGKGSTVNGSNSIAIGSGHTVSGNNSGAFGDPDVIEGNNSYIIGNNSRINVDDAFVLGNSASVTANGGVALGTGSVASRGVETKLGYDMSTPNQASHTAADSDVKGVWAPTAAAVSVGKIDTANPENNITRRITGVAAGSDDTDAVNVAQLKAFVGESPSSGGDGVHYYSVPDTDPINHEPNYNNDEAKGEYAMAAGVGTLAYGDRTTSVGANAIAYGNDNIALGTNAIVHGEVQRGSGKWDKNRDKPVTGSIAIGVESKNVGNYNTALGGMTSINGQEAGNYTDTAGDYNTAIGYNSGVYSWYWWGAGKDINYSTAIGANAYAGSNNSTVVGYNAYANDHSSVAIGSNTSINGNARGTSGYAIAIGAGNLDADGYRLEPSKNRVRDIYDWDNISYAGAASSNMSVAIGTGSYADMQGAYNVAIGFNSKALGEGSSEAPESSGSIAIGAFSYVKGQDKTAIGKFSTAQGIGSIALGVDARSGNNTLGDDLTNDSGNEIDSSGRPISDQYNGVKYTRGDDSIAIGHRAGSYGDGSIAFGVGTFSLGSMAIAEGAFATANTTDSIAIGDHASIQWHNQDSDETKRVATSAIAIGNYSKADGKDATAVGRQSQALRRNATAYGNNSHANAWNSVAIGNKAIAGIAVNIEEANGNAVADENDDNGDLLKGAKSGQSAVAVGNRARATREYTTAVGASTAAEGWHAVAVGDSNRATGKFSTAIGAGWSEYKVIKDGKEETDNDNKEWERTYSAIGANQAAGDYSTSVGYGNKTAGERSNALGMQNEIAGSDSLGIGTFNKVGKVEDGDDKLLKASESDVTGFAVGSNNTITGEAETYAGAYGHNNTVTGNNSYAIGNDNEVSGEMSLAVGTGNKVTGDRSGAFGDPNELAGSDSYIVGNNNSIDSAAERSFVVGHESGVTVADAVALGSYSLGNRGAGLGNDGKVHSGYDMLTQKEYAGDDKESPTWRSTAGAVSVGGKTQNGKVVTRQITNVAAGYEDTDAVNVAQLKRARTGVEPGENVTVVENITQEGDIISYTINGSEVLKGDFIQSVVKGERDVDETDPDKGKVTTFTVNGMKTELTSSDNSVEITGGDKADEKGIFTYDLKVKGGGGNINITSDDDTVIINQNGDTYDLSVVGGKDTITNIEAGDNVTVENISKEGDTNITYKVSAKDTKIKNVKADYSTVNDNSNKGKLTITDTEGTEFTTDVENTYTVKAETNPEDHTVTFTRNDGGTYQINNIATMDDINNIRGDIYNLDNKIEKVGAGAAALAGLHPLDFDPDEKWDFAASVGSYRSEQAVAIGAFYRPNEDTMFSIGGTIGNGNNMVNVGVSWKFGQKNRISANRISSAKEIIELRKNQEDVHSFLADAVAGNQLDLSKIQLFPDVEENHWAYDYVATMAGNGVLEGYPDGYFKGNRNMTRYEMAAVLYRLMQNGARLSDRALTEFAPELDRIRVDTITHHKDGTPHIQRVRTIKERVDEKSDLSPEKAEKKKAKIKVAEKPVE